MTNQANQADQADQASNQESTNQESPQRAMRERRCYLKEQFNGILENYHPHDKLERSKKLALKAAFYAGASAVFLVCFKQMATYRDSEGFPFAPPTKEELDTIDDLLYEIQSYPQNSLEEFSDSIIDSIGY